MITTYNLQKNSTAYKTLSLLVYIQELTYFQMRNIQHFGYINEPKINVSFPYQHLWQNKQGFKQQQNSDCFNSR